MLVGTLRVEVERHTSCGCQDDEPAPMILDELSHASQSRFSCGLPVTQQLSSIDQVNVKGMVL
jgi:hypothetical protein